VVELLPSQGETLSSNPSATNNQPKKDIRRWKDLQCSWISRIHIVKMTILLRAVYRFMQSPSKFQSHPSKKSRKKILKFVWKHKRPRIAKAIQSKKSNAGVYQIILQSHSKKNSMAVAQKQMHRSMEHKNQK
jgi:hypothetical protein